MPVELCLQYLHYNKLTNAQNFNINEFAETLQITLGLQSMVKAITVYFIAIQFQTCGFVCNCIYCIKQSLTYAMSLHDMDFIL